MPDHESTEHSEALTDAEARSVERRSDTENRVILFCGVIIATYPLVWLVLTYLAALNNVKLVLDDRILQLALWSQATIIAFAFGKEAVKRFMR